MTLSGQDAASHEHEPLPLNAADRPKRPQVGRVRPQLQLSAVDHELKVQVAGSLITLRLNFNPARIKSSKF